MSTVSEYVNKVTAIYSSGHASEHSYRPVLKELFEIATGLTVINEPKRSEFGAPDFIFLKGKIVVAYAEAKDLNILLNDVEDSEQMVRYYGYSNIILTNGLDFRFYRNGTKYGESVIIGKLKGESIETYEDSFQLLLDTIDGFIKESKEPIKSGSVLSKVMAGKARRIRDNVKKFLEDENNPKNTNLLNIYKVIKELLISDLNHVKFADMYAQTIVYGLFAARYSDKTTEDFSRQEARDLVPASNPFLRHFFDHIAGASFDPRIEYIIKELCEEFNHADVREIVHKYYKQTDPFGNVHENKDPIIHFYEDFLQEYDSAERKKMGVFYTPLPVVRFIINSIDDILKNDFNLPKGLADSSRVNIIKEVQGKQRKVSVNKVQILDPATGTGTFLNQTILFVKKSLQGQLGSWASYVNENLLPRLHGFELMMASYTIAHLKLSSTIAETGAKIENTRLGVYLTNSLEKTEIKERTLFDIGLGKAITEESSQASKIKNELPIMVVIGNPPYAGESSNKDYTDHNVYKFEPGTTQKLKERNSKWINDDYVKFIRLAESFVEKNGEGIVGMITAHGYLDNPTFRGMRWHLMNTFNKIYVLDLHGNVKKREKAPDGSSDKNVFDIQQGVAIFIGIKQKENKSKCKIFYEDCFGTKENKFKYLENSIEQIQWKEINPSGKNLEWRPRNNKIVEIYNLGFSLAEAFPVNSAGIVSGDDESFIKFTKKEFNQEIEDNIKPITYRMFDIRYINYNLKTITRARIKVMKEFLKENLGLTFVRNDPGVHNFSHFFLSKIIVDAHLHPGLTYAAPLYIYENEEKVANLNKEIITKIERIASKSMTPEEIFDYIYAVLYSPSYREKYKELLKLDFPRVPYPDNKNQFQSLVSLGHELRQLHLFESNKLNTPITTYDVMDGLNSVEKIVYKDNKVYINKDKYFGNVPEIAWSFSIGGYLPAQRWLKDRRGRELTSEDIDHYQKIIVALVETDRIMKEIDKVIQL